MLQVQTVRAQGETPTEPPVPTEVETEPGEEPTEAPTEAPTEIPLEETPTPVSVLPTESTPEPVETEATPSPVAEVLTQVPEGTEVVVIDEEGEVIPLAAEEAADIAEAFDPMWCPAGVLPGGAGCTTNFASIAALITDMINNTSSYTQNGIIYFVATTGVQTTGASLNLTTTGLNTGDFNTLNDYSLTLQGGWNGQNGNSATFTGTTNFGTNAVTIGTNTNPWAGSITLNNFSFNGVSSTNSITVYTTSGDITLNDINVSQQAGENYAALLNSSNGGDITIDDSTFDGNNTAGNESLGVSATTGTGSIAISDTTFQQANQNGGSFSNGATLSASTVTLTNVTATQNDGNGIAISNASQVNLTNVTSSPATNGAGNGRSGVLVTGTGSTVVSVGGGVFADNGRYGIEVTGGSIFIRSNPTCPTTGNTSNGLGCYSPSPSTDLTPPVITPSISGTAGANGWYTSNVTVSWSVSDPQSGILSSTCTTTTLTSETSGTSLSCSAVNGAGLTTNATPLEIKIDKTAPTAALAITGGTTGANGWYTSDVTVSTTGADALSGATCTNAQVLSTDTSGLQVNGSCTNGAGLVTNATPITVKLDKTAPNVSLQVTAGTAGANGWYTSDVTISTVGSESVSTPISCTPDQFQTAETTGANFNGSCTNDAGLSANASISIKVDKTDPSITFINRTAPNANGWNNTNVTVNWTCSDQFSGPAADNVSQIVSTEGAGQSAAGTCTDLAGNSASDTQGGINIDKTAPTLILPTDITAEATSSAGANVPYTASADDNLDPNAAISCDPASNSLFPFGQTQVGCSSTDQADNTASGSFLVTVGDTTGPVIAFHADVTAEATSASGALVNYTAPTAADAVDGPVSVSCNPASNTQFALGDTTVTCSAADSNNNQSQSTFTVHVLDTTGPVIAFHADVTAEATSAQGALVTYAAPTATDAVDGEVQVVCQPASNTQFALGDTTVTCTAADSNNNQSQSTFTVHVLDTTGPVIAKHQNIFVEATGPNGAQVTYDTPSATDAVTNPVTVTCVPASGLTFPLGVTTVTCNAMDEAQNQAAPVSFTITVRDTTPPSFGDLPNITVPATSASGAVVTFSVTANDIVDGTVPAACSPASGTTFPIGTTTVTCTATDTAGNTSGQGSFFVNVYDPAGPILSLPGNLVVEATSAGGAQVNFTATATDLQDGNVPVTCLPASGSTFGIGSTQVTCTASDLDEPVNTNTGSFFVIVQDTTPPVILPHADFTTVTDNPGGVVVTYFSPATIDVVDGAGTATCAPASGTTFPIGTTTVTCTATDSHGNTAASTFLVRVELSTPGPIDPGTETSEGGSSSLIPLTGGSLIDLDCDSVLWAFGIRLSFFNLCEHQTTLNSVDAGNLPGSLPQGYSFVMALDVDILSQGQLIDELPDGSGIELDFPTYGQPLDEFAVLFWSESEGKWIEVTAQIDAGELTQTLSEAGDLYQVLDETQSDVFYQMLTTQDTGIFVLVTK